MNTLTWKRVNATLHTGTLNTGPMRATVNARRDGNRWTGDVEILFFGDDHKAAMRITPRRTLEEVKKAAQEEIDWWF